MPVYPTRASDARVSDACTWCPCTRRMRVMPVYPTRCMWWPCRRVYVMPVYPTRARDARVRCTRRMQVDARVSDACMWWPCTRRMQVMPNSDTFHRIPEKIKKTRKSEWLYTSVFPGLYWMIIDSHNYSSTLSWSSHRYYIRRWLCGSTMWLRSCRRHAAACVAIYINYQKKNIGNRLFFVFITMVASDSIASIVCLCDCAKEMHAWRGSLWHKNENFRYWTDFRNVVQWVSVPSSGGSRGYKMFMTPKNRLVDIFPHITYINYVHRSSRPSLGGRLGGLGGSRLKLA